MKFYICDARDSQSSDLLTISLEGDGQVTSKTVQVIEGAGDSVSFELFSPHEVETLTFYLHGADAICFDGIFFDDQELRDGMILFCLFDRVEFVKVLSW